MQDYTLDDLEVYIPTSYTMRCPETKTIERTIDTFRERFNWNFHADIVCDGLAPMDAEFHDDYVQYIKNLHDRLTNVTIHVLPEWRGLAGSVLHFFADIWTKPLIFNLQHDWKAIRPIHIDCILDALSKGARYIRFHKRHIQPVAWSMQYLEKSEEFQCPLSKVGSWCDLPHFATYEHYRRFVIPYMYDTNRGAAGRRGCETRIYWKYHADISEMGFEKAHAKWRVYVYGWPGDKPVIRHIAWNVTAARRRKARETLQKKEQDNGHMV